MSQDLMTQKEWVVSSDPPHDDQFVRRILSEGKTALSSSSSLLSFADDVLCGLFGPPSPCCAPYLRQIDAVISSRCRQSARSISRCCVICHLVKTFLTPTVTSPSCLALRSAILRFCVTLLSSAHLSSPSDPLPYTLLGEIWRSIFGGEALSWSAHTRALGLKLDGVSEDGELVSSHLQRCEVSRGCRRFRDCVRDADCVLRRRGKKHKKKKEKKKCQYECQCQCHRGSVIVTIHWHRGMSLAQLGSFEEALQGFTVARDLVLKEKDRSRVTRHSHFGGGDQGRLAERILVCMAWCKCGLGDFDTARKWMNEATGIQPAEFYIPRDIPEIDLLVPYYEQLGFSDDVLDVIRNLNSRNFPTATLPTMRYCEGCHLLLPRGLLRSCGGCQVARYCSRKCQVADWENHRVTCRHLAKKRST